MEEFNNGRATALNMNRGMLKDLGSVDPEGKKILQFSEVQDMQQTRELA